MTDQGPRAVLGDLGGDVVSGVDRSELVVLLYIKSGDAR